MENEHFRAASWAETYVVEIEELVSEYDFLWSSNFI